MADSRSDIYQVQDLYSTRLVNNLARCGVGLVVSNVVRHHDDDVIVRDPVIVDYLVGVTHISLDTPVQLLRYMRLRLVSMTGIEY